MKTQKILETKPWTLRARRPVIWQVQRLPTSKPQTRVISLSQPQDQPTPASVDVGWRLAA